MQSGIGFTRMTADGIVTEGRALYYGIIIEATAAGAPVTVYEGLDSDSGRMFAKYADGNTAPRMQPNGYPVFFDRGIYVDLGANVTAATILWLPVPREE